MKNPEEFEAAFEKYSVEKVLGEGGAGRVFAVRNSNGVAMALKCLFPKIAATEKRKRFKNEVDFCRRGLHKNIIQVIDEGLIAWDGTKTPFYVMPFFPTTLRALIEKKLAPVQALTLFSQMMDGVEAAHLLGVTHRDLKPENILYNPSQDVLVVADFGIAHFEEDFLATTVETQATAKLANLAYSAPEQRAKGSKVDLRADIYALGLMLNEIFTTVVPHGTGYQKIGAIASDYAYLDSLVECMIQQSPDARPSTIDEIKQELIGRKNSFIAQQRLDAKKREVVPASTPQQFVPIKLVNIDWDKAMLFELDQVPLRKWIELFRSPSGYVEIYGHGPSAFGFQKNIVRIDIQESLAPQIANHFKEYLRLANQAYQQFLSAEAQQRDIEERRRLERDIAEAETRARILKSVKV